MKSILFVLDHPSFHAVREGNVITRYMTKMLERMAPKLQGKYDILLLRDEPFPKSASEAEKSRVMQQHYDDCGGKLGEYDLVVGFGKYAAKLVTGYPADSAWSMPVYNAASSNRRWGFYDLDYCAHGKGVLLPHLHKLVGRIEKVLEGGEIKDFNASVPIVTNPTDALGILQEMFDNAGAVAVDVENNPATGIIMRIGLSWEKGAISLPFHEYDTAKWGTSPALKDLPNGVACFELIDAILGATHIKKVGHNIHHDFKVLTEAGFTVRGEWDDTLVMHATLYPDAPHGLGFVAAYALDVHPWKRDFKVGTEDKGLDVFVKRDPEELAQYNARDCIATLGAWVVLREEVQNTPSAPKTYLLNKEKARIAADMGRIGVHFDQEAAERHRVRLKDKLGKIQRVLNNVVGWEFNPNSTLHIRRFLFDEMGVVPHTYTEKGAPSTSEESLSVLKGHPDKRVATVASGILEYRESGKLLGSYLNNIEVGKDGRVHPDWKTWGAKTGRWACTDPALQTIPKIMRDLYCAAPGKFLIYPDMSQLELRTMAALSKDLPAIKTFQSGFRVHTKNAQDIFRLGSEKPTEKQETVAKTVVYTINYGGTPKTVHTRLQTMGENVSLEFCESLFDSWFAAHPALKKYLDSTYKFVCENLYFELPFGGRRLTWWQEPSRQEVANHPNQASGADIMDHALITLETSFRGTEHKIVGQIHDALLVETDNVLEACELIQDAMYYEWKVEIDGEIHILPFPCGFECSEKSGNWLTMNKFKGLEDVRKAAAEGKFK